MRIRFSDLLFVLISLMLFSCGGSSCPDIFIEEHQIIDAVNEAENINERNTKSKEGFSIYLDYSMGMKVAFDDEKTSAFYNLFINSLKISKVDFYEVDKHKVEKIESTDKSELYKKIKATQRFVGNNAPLDKAVDRIIAENKEAVLITDGELWNEGERDDPWAREAFSKWLKEGNKLEFYVTDHFDAGKQKHIFYMFFVPTGKDKGVTSDLKFYLKKSTEANKLTYHHFSFANNMYALIQEYPSEAQAGINEYAEADAETYINKGKEKGYEYVELYLAWKDIINYIAKGTDDNGKAIENGLPLFSKLFLDTEQLKFYNIEDIDINVYDISKSFDKFRKIEEAKRNPPTFVLDEKGEKMLDEQNSPILECSGQSGAYEQETGKLLIDTVYKAGENKPIKELFVFDKKAFDNNLKEKNRGEIVIKIHPNFNGSQLNDEDYNLHRIDVVIKKASVNTSNPEVENFIWTGKHVEKNRSIYNSILGALNDANPSGKIIYSYYIKTLPNDYMP